MTGVHVAPAPGHNGWQRLRADGMWKTSVPAEVREVEAALRADTADCESCLRGGPVRHATTYVRVNEAGKSSAYTYHCLSRSRWFNPQTRQMEGRPHCTCDYCF